MLAHMKSKQREHNNSSDESVEDPQENINCSKSAPESQCDSMPVTCPSTKMTCDALCSLGNAPLLLSHQAIMDYELSEDSSCSKKVGVGCSKQHQLPMFLSSKYDCNAIVTLD
jgi:hypothetical protein